MQANRNKQAHERQSEYLRGYEAGRNDCFPGRYNAALGLQGALGLGCGTAYAHGRLDYIDDLKADDVAQPATT